MNIAHHWPKSWNEKVNTFLLFLPIWFVVIADWLEFNSKGVAGGMRLLSLALMLFVTVLKVKTHTRLFWLSLVFIPWLIIHIGLSFNLNAGIEDGIRYLIPIVVLFYAYAIRKQFAAFISFYILFVIVGDCWQIINYINWLRGVDQWFYMTTHTGVKYNHEISGLLRASGLVGFHGLFGFINLIGFFLTKRYYTGKYKSFFLGLMVVSLFLSFSYKAIGPFLIILFIESDKKAKILTGMFASLMLGVVLFPVKLLDFFVNAWNRISYYIIVGDSARAESYRVMFSETGIIGEGVGCFGGAASTKYISPYYQEVNFNWFNTTHLATTDTYFPHLFVELGLPGGLLYLMLLFAPLKWAVNKQARRMLWIIYIALFFDSLFSFALNNLSYCTYSLCLVYAIIAYEKSITTR